MILAWFTIEGGFQITYLIPLDPFLTLRTFKIISFFSVLGTHFKQMSIVTLDNHFFLFDVLKCFVLPDSDVKIFKFGVVLWLVFPVFVLLTIFFEFRYVGAHAVEPSRVF